MEVVEYFILPFQQKEKKFWIKISLDILGKISQLGFLNILGHHRESLE